jgi:hypothetical protein
LRATTDNAPRYPKALLTTSLLPAHVYICSLRALKILDAIPTFHSIKEDFVPFLCKMQWQAALLKKHADGELAMTHAFGSAEPGLGPQFPFCDPWRTRKARPSPFHPPTTRRPYRKKPTWTARSTRCPHPNGRPCGPA